MLPQFLNEQQFRECEEDLGDADVNVDLILDKAEYLSAIEIRSDGALTYTSFEELPLSLVSTFLFSACSYQSCAGIDPEIPIADVSVTSVFCFNLDIAIATEIGPTAPPVAVETLAPTKSPTTMPTVAPVTASPTKAPTKSPTFVGML